METSTLDKHLSVFTASRALPPLRETLSAAIAQLSLYLSGYTITSAQRNDAAHSTHVGTKENETENPFLSILPSFSCTYCVCVEPFQYEDV